MFIIQNYAVFCRLMSSHVRWKKYWLCNNNKLLALIRMILIRKAFSYSYSQVTVSIRIPVYWVGISDEKVQVYRDLVKNPWEFLWHKGISLFLSHAHISPLVVQANFDLLSFSEKPDFHKIIEILSLYLLKTTSF